MTVLVLLLLGSLWFIPPLLTKTDLPYRGRQAASLSALLLGFIIMVLISWQQYGWSRDMLWALGAAGLYCALVLVFTLEFLRQSKK
jgi:hypothetical protein